MLMLLPQRRYHHNLRLTDGLTILANWLQTVAILVNYQSSYNTSHTMKPSDLLLLANVPLHCKMYPAGKADISRHLATPGFPQSDHTIGEPSADTVSLCSECQPAIFLDYRFAQTDTAWFHIQNIKSELTYLYLCKLAALLSRHMLKCSSDCFFSLMQ